MTIVGVIYVKYNYDFSPKEKSSFFSDEIVTQEAEKVMKFVDLKAKLYEFIESNSSSEIKKKYNQEWNRMLIDAGIYSSMSLMKDLNLTHVPFGELPEIYYEIREKLSETIPQIRKTCGGELMLYKNQEEIANKYKEFDLHHTSEVCIKFQNQIIEFKKRQLRGMINSINEDLISEKEKKTLIGIQDSIIESKECFFEYEFDEENYEYNLKIIENSEIYSKIIRTYEKIFKTEVEVKEFPHTEL